MGGNIQHYKKDLLSALYKTRGIVTQACELVGCNRSTYYEYYNNDSEFKKDVDDLNDVALDFAESKLFEKMEGIELGKEVDGEMVVYKVPPSDTALIFYLKTKGKKRGYIERVETQEVTPQPVIVESASKEEEERNQETLDNLEE